MNETNEAIKTVGLTKRYKSKTAVDSLNLTIYSGELFSLLGINGAGKTTTIKLLSCLTSPTSGDAFLNGRSIVSESYEVKKIINVSPQETAVAPNLSVRENLELIYAIYGHTKAEARVKTGDIIEKTGLAEVEKSRASTLSGGWQRKLSIAMALISEPEILFLDEPTVGLDIIARRSLWEMISSLKQKATIILTTHYLEEAEAVSDRIGIMSKGKMTAVGTASELIEKAGAANFEDAFVALAGGKEVN